MRNVIKISIKGLAKVLTLLCAVSLVSFILVSLSPVDPVQQYILGAGTVTPIQRLELEKYWGVNESMVGRYLNWLKAILQGDMGISLLYRRPVIDIIKERFMNTFPLMVLAFISSGFMGFTIGCVMGMFKNRLVDRVLKRICLILSSVPTFWLGLIFLLFFSVYLGWFPIGFSAPIGVFKENVTIGQKIHHMILPAMTLSFISFSGIALHTREKLIEVLESDYVLFAKARGESNWSILMRHGLRNIIVPAITLQFGTLAELFGGSVLAEQVFSYPGLGSAISAAGLNSDVPLLLGITLFSALFVFCGNLLADILYGIINPQIRKES